MAITSTRGARSRLALAGALSLAIVGSLAACAPPADETADGEVSGTLQVLVSSAEGSDNAYEELNAAFEAAYPDVTVEFSSVPNDAFAAARSSRLTAGNLDVTLGQPFEVPDFVADPQLGDDALSADAGLFLDLTDEPFLDNFTPSVIDSIAYNGKNYTVPTGLSYYTGVFYNKTLFEDLGLEIPTTWSEFQEVAEAIQDSGVSPLGIGGKDGWPAGLAMQAVVQSLFPTKADKIDLASGIYAGDVSLTDPELVEVLDKVEYLYSVTQPNFAGIAYTAIPSEFASGNIAMTIDGTWNQTTIDAAVNGDFEYGYFPLPSSEDPADNASFGGKVEIRMIVPTNAPNQEAALAYLEFFSDPENYAAFVATCGFAPAQPDIPASEFLQSIEPFTAQFEPAWDGTWVPNLNAGPAALLAFNYAGIAPLGTLSPEDAAAAAEADWAAAG